VKWDLFGAELDSLISEKSPKPETLNKAKRWGKEVTLGLTFWQPWIDRVRPEEKSFVDSWTKYVSSPWDSAAHEQAQQDRDALTIGTDIWARYANESGDSWEAFCTKVNSAADGKVNKRVKTVVNAWIEAFERTAEWKIKFHSAKAPKGYGTKRYISTFNSGGSRWSEWVQWPSEEGVDPPDRSPSLPSPPDDHTSPVKISSLRPPSVGAPIYYSFSSEDFDNLFSSEHHSNRQRDLKWKVGEPFTVWVEGESSKLLLGKLPDLLDETRTGPVVLWTLRSRTTLGKAPYQIELEVLNCPGPP